MSTSKRYTVLACTIAGTMSWATHTADARPAVLLRPERVFTATGTEAEPGWAVLIEGTRITAVGPAEEVSGRANGRVIDLPGTTLMPGLMDLHVHVFLHPYDEAPWNDQVLKEPVAYRTIAAALHAKATLQAGLTTVRDLGTEGARFAAISVRRAITDGLIDGPRLLVSTRAIVATDCYGPGPRGFRPDLQLPLGALREPLRVANRQVLCAAVAMVDESIRVSLSMQSLLQSIHCEIRAQRRRCTPAHDPTREHIDHERDVREA